MPSLAGLVPSSRPHDLSLTGQGQVGLHELAFRVSAMLGTDAIKHGALSPPGGRVQVGWTLTGEPGTQHLSLYWREEGRPRYSQRPPTASAPG
jgi:hypothetical protein